MNGKRDACRSGRRIATRVTPHTLSAKRRHFFTTDAILNGMPPHIAQLILGHEDINTTMGYKAVYPEEAIRGHRAFITQRRATRPSEEYRTPTDAEWDEFLGHFQRRRVALGDCGRAYSTPCIHEHSCFSELTVLLSSVRFKVRGRGRGEPCQHAGGTTAHGRRSRTCIQLATWSLVGPGCR
jgi:hypothetical protein